MGMGKDVDPKYTIKSWGRGLDKFSMGRGAIACIVGAVWSRKLQDWNFILFVWAQSYS